MRPSAQFGFWGFLIKLGAFLNFSTGQLPGVGGVLSMNFPAPLW